MSDTTFDGRTALVTGATRGIGQAIAEELGRHGAHVLVVGRDADRGEDVVSRIRNDGGKADFIGADLRDATSAKELARRAVEFAGQVDVLVNNAGLAVFGPTRTASEADFDAVYGVNVKGPYFLVAELAPAMAERGSGAIVSLISLAAMRGDPMTAVYGSSKAALALLTKSWAAEFGPKGVRVNAVSPGPTRTPGTEVMGEALDQRASQAPAGRVADPAEIATAVVYLASDAASFIHGAVVPVDGGRLAT
jgi:NAD(P)-dependent dehydrogenase (short-subunit alcohol dehydrogenase family)